MTNNNHNHYSIDQQEIERLRNAISDCSEKTSKLNITLLNINENIKEETNLITAAQRQLTRIKTNR